MGEGRDHCTVVSAPGKVLLTGAYLVLEQPNAGLVLSTSARFFAIAKPLHAGQSSENQTAGYADVRVVSPQLQRISAYRLAIPTLHLEQSPPASSGGNPFVENAVTLAVAAACVLQDRRKGGGEHVSRQLLRQGLEITLLGGNDFYSHRMQLLERGLPLCSASLAALPAFSLVTANAPSATGSTPVPGAATHTDPEVAKTGLGSSAAMTTAVVGALLHHLQAVDLCEGPSPGEAAAPVQGSLRSPSLSLRGEALEVVHRVAQAAHCAAQGKVGSGFDVSAAVFGSQRYVRFSPQLLHTALGGSRAESTPAERLKGVLDGSWDCCQEPWALPPGLLLMIGEPGAGGSSTPSMVGAVQRWRRQHPELAASLWAGLAASNKDVENGLLLLRQRAAEDRENFLAVLEVCSRSPASQWQHATALVPQSFPAVATLLATRQAFSNVRTLLRQMGKEAGVPIEPTAQTEVLDATVNLEGVLLAGVPGAGGFDAVFAVVIGPTARTTVESFWSQRGVLTLCAVEDAKGLQLETSSSISLACE